jgi:hypothetical protein
MSGLVINILNERDSACLSGGRRLACTVGERPPGGQRPEPALRRLLAVLGRLMDTRQRNIAINIALNGSSILHTQVNGLSIRPSA